VASVNYLAVAEEGEVLRMINSPTRSKNHALFEQNTDIRYLDGTQQEWGGGGTVGVRFGEIQTWISNKNHFTM